ncbi:MAG: efflux RND transporter periplasmic adaptor subunit [Clostridiales Family XIII bacterium]|jgi:RND family efflux transporter MFP subunit|nr:efflux RND transporter periplasmic adaptor subunit [Clostridiales Family XIII bacterium]
MSKVSDFARNHRKPVILLAVIVVIAIIAGIVFFTRGDTGANENQEISTLKLSRMDIEQIVTATGSLKSIDSRSITTSQTSKITSVNVSEGQIVKGGDTLCTFDTSLLDINIAATQKSLDAAKAQAEESIAQANRMVSDAREQLDYDQKRSDAEVSKAKDALDDAKADPSDSPEAIDAIPSLQAAYDTAVSTRDATIRADNVAIKSAEDALKNQQLMDSSSQLQSQLLTYQKQKEEATIKSPIDGTVTSVNATVDSYAGMESPLFVIEDISKLEVAASVPEYDAAKLATDLNVHIITDALQGVEWSGKIKSISPVASDTSGNFTIIISVTSEIGELKSGMSAKVNIVTGSKENVFAVPYGTLIEKGDGDTVIYAKDTDSGTSSGKASKDEAAIKWREIIVTAGLETDYYVEISGHDLAGGLIINADPEGLNKDAPSESIMDMF